MTEDPKKQKDPYEILNILKTSTKEEIRKAYILLCKIHHPDMGGDEHQFRLLVWAYELLIDDDKRKKYDQYGIIEHFNKEQIIGLAKENLIGLFKSIINSTEFIQTAGRINVMFFAIRKIEENKIGASNHLQELKKRKANLSIAIRRIKRKKHDNDNFIVKALEQEKMELRKGICNVKMDIKIIKKMGQLVEEFEYNMESELDSYNQSQEWGIIKHE